MSATVEIIGQTADLTADNNAGISKDYVVTGVSSADSAVIATRDFLVSVLGSPPSIGPLVLDQISCTEDELNIFRCTASWKTFARRSKPTPAKSQSFSSICPETRLTQGRLCPGFLLRVSPALQVKPMQRQNPGNQHWKREPPARASLSTIPGQGEQSEQPA